MKKLFFDIETSDIFSPEKKNPEDLTISVVGIYSEAHDIYKAFEVEEFDELWKIVKETDTLVGFNSNHFDIPLLNKYSPIDITKTHKSIDILEDVRNSLGRRLKLDSIAEGTLGVKKSGHGLRAVELWKEGKKQEVKDYCIDDVKITKRVFDHALKNKKLKYADFGTIHEFAIDISKWEDDTINAYNASLF